MAQINGVVHPCYLCGEFTPRPPLQSGIFVCEPCMKREFPIVEYQHAELTLNGKPFPEQKDFEIRVRGPRTIKW